MDINKVTAVYFVDVGGIRTSALIRYFLVKGRRVGGYDKTPSGLTEELREEGTDIHCEDNVALIGEASKSPDDTLVIYMSTVPESHTELAYFRARGFEVTERTRVLEEIMESSRGLCVAGAHGKTTTSSILAHLLKRLPVDCNAFLGGILKNYESNLILSDTSDFTMIEADEFDRSFHWLIPYMAMITSANPDYLDIYGTAEAHRESFEKFTSLVRPNDCLLIKKGINVTSRLQKGVKRYTYSVMEIADFHIENIRVCDGNIIFDFVDPEVRIPDVELGVPVEANIENGVAATAIAWLNGVKPEDLKRGMATSAGPRRRFDFHLKTDQVVLIDDYVHHPAGLRQNILSVKELYVNRKVTGIFQPHLYTHTRDFAGDFATSFSLLGGLILLDIYPAREEPIPGASSRIILDKVTVSPRTSCKKEELLDVAAAGKHEVVLMVGAGNISRLVEPVKETLCKQIRKP